MHIREAKRNDMEQLSNLIKEHTEEINLTEKSVLSKEYLTTHCFEETPPSFKCFVAFMRTEKCEQLIGYVIYNDVYSTWVGKTMMVDDMFIQRDYRENKFLKGVMNLIMNFCRENKYNRLEFKSVKNDALIDYHLSKGALDLCDSDTYVNYIYDGENCREPEKWLCYRLPNEIMKKMARGSDA